MATAIDRIDAVQAFNEEKNELIEFEGMELDKRRIDQDLANIGASLLGDSGGRISESGTFGIPHWNRREALNALDDVHGQFMDILAAVEGESSKVDVDVSLLGREDVAALVKADFDVVLDAIERLMVADGMKEPARRAEWLIMACAVMERLR